MKRSLLILAVMVAGLTFAGSAFAQGGGGQRPAIFAPPATPSGPLVDVVNAVVAACNSQDKAFFQKTMTPETIWFDEDGHHMAGPVWMNRILSATPARKLSISNLRVANCDTAGWAGFNYMVDEGVRQLKGVATITFKKNGNDWQIAMIHTSIDTPVAAH